MSSYFWFLLLLTVTAATTSECPQDCICSPIRNQQTPHHDHAICTTLNDVTENYPTIHSLDLSSNNLDTIPVKLNSLQNVTHLDLSKNHLTKLTKLNNRIRSLDLSHNRLTSSEIVKISPKIRILNLSFNQITHLPLDVMHLKSLKSINLIGNRIDCSCETLTVRDWLQQNNVWMNKHTICASPLEQRHQPWDKVSITQMCQIDERNENKIELHHRSSKELELSDFIAEEFLPFKSHSILKRQVPNDDNLDNFNNDDGSGIEDIPTDDTIDVGSGEGSGTDNDIDIENSETNENVSPEDYDDVIDEGSGSGYYGILPLDTHSNGEETHITEEPEPLDDSPTKKPIELNIFEGNRQVDETTVAPIEVIEPTVQKIKQEGNERAAPVALPPAGSSPILPPTDAGDDGGNTKKADEGSNTYILLAILGILLVSLIAYVVVKRRNNRRRSSYNHNDAENIREIEMLDMKKNANGKQPDVEIIPLMPKKEQPKIERGMSDPNREINSNIQPLHATNYPKIDAVPLKQNDVPRTTDALPENNNNNCSEIEPQPSQEIPCVADETDDNTAKKPIQNGHNGHLSDDEVFLPEEPTVKRYSPVYSPETGRVKIKLTETPKPKTPMLVTRSRSNAGAYITTPNLNIRSTSTTNGQ